MSWIITPRVCSARLRWVTAHLHNFSNSPTFTSPFVVLSHAAVTERRRVALMGGINKLVKLPISNHRSAWQRRAVPAGNRFSPVHQRSHEPRGSSCVPKCPQLLLNGLWLTVSRGGFRISEHQGLGSDPPPARRGGGGVSPHLKHLFFFGRFWWELRSKLNYMTLWNKNRTDICSSSG